MMPEVQQPVLVTGATGFIGRRLVRRLVELRGVVTCLVRTEAAGAEIRAAGGRVVVGDVTDRGSVERALRESGAASVFHLAGAVRAVCPGREKAFMAVNAEGTENVASACAGCVRPPVLVVVSSLAVMGPSAKGTGHREGDSPKPISAYGRSKLAGEGLATQVAERVPLSIVRPPIVFGPGERGLLQVFRSIARLGATFVPGSGASGLSLIHVDDLVEGLLLVGARGERVESEAEWREGRGVYFLAGDEVPTHVELARAIGAALGRAPISVVRIPGGVLRMLGTAGDLLGMVGRRPGWVNGDKMAEAVAGSWVCSSAKAQTQLAWAGPALSLAERLSETAAWYRSAGWL